MPSWKKVITSGSDAELNSLYAPSITGSLHGTASWAQNALTASYSPNLTISGSITSVNYIDFNTGSAVPAWKSGRVYWDNTDGALAVYNAEADITLQVGQENWVRVYNNTGLPITDGTPVRLVGSQGDVPLIVLAQSLTGSGLPMSENQIIGVATHDIENNSIGYVTTSGIVRGLNTNAFADGDVLFVSSSAGKLTNIAPIAPYEIIQVGVVVKAGPGGSGIIYVDTRQPQDLSDLTSIERGIYNYGDILTFVQSGSFGVWRHTNQLSGSYGITGSLIISSSGVTNDFQVGSNKLFVSASGNVGIGTTTPLNKFSISSTISDPIRAAVNSDTLYNRILFQKPSQTWSAGALNTGDFAIADETAVAYRFRIFSGSSNVQINANGTGSVSIGTTITGTAKLHVNNTTTQNSFLVEDSTNPDATPFVIDNTGNVGIGTTTPTRLLQVENSQSILFFDPTSTGGDLRITGSTGVPRMSIAIPASASKPLTGFQLGMRTWGDTSFTGYGKVGDSFFYAGNETNGFNILNPAGTGTEDYIRFYAGQLATDTADIHIQGAGSTRGNVGIGKETPNAKLDVLGNTTITGSLIVSSSGATNDLRIGNNKLIISGSQIAIGKTISNYSNPTVDIVSDLIVSGSGAGDGIKSNYGIRVGNSITNPTNSQIAVQGYSSGYGGYFSAYSQTAGVGVYGYSSDDGSEFASGDTIGGLFEAAPPTAGFPYAVQLVDGTEGAGKILVSQTSDGKANWSTRLSGSYEITGSLTVSGSSTFTNIGSTIFSGSVKITGSAEIAGDFIPSLSSSYTLGSITNPWKGIYIQSGSISIQSDTPGNPETILSNEGGNIKISAGGMQLLGSGSFNASTGSFGYISGSLKHVGVFNNIGEVTITGSFDASSYPNKIIAITELTSSTLVTHTVGTTNFTAINLNSDGTNRFAKASFIAPLSGRVEIYMEFDMTIVNAAAVQMIGLHNTSSATSTPSEGWYRVNADNDATSGQFYAKFIKTGLTPGTAYNYYFMGVCNFSGNTIRTSRIQTGSYVAGSDLPSPLRIYVYDLGNTLITSNPSS